MVAAGAGPPGAPSTPARVNRPAPLSVTIRSRLLLLVLSVLLPGLLGMVWLIDSTFRAEREANQRTLRDTTRALSMVIDSEIGQRAMLARVLAQSRWLDDAPELGTQQMLAFEQQARRALQGLDGWIELRSATAVLLDTRETATSAPPPAAGGGLELADLPLVQPLRLDQGPDKAYAAVVQPVVRRGRLALNLVVTMRPVELQRIIDAQALPRGWVGTVLDNRGTVVARQPGADSYIGRSATPDLRQRLTAGTEGLFESVSLDGHRTAGYYSTSAHGWTYLTAMPREQFAGLVPAAVLQVIVGSLLLLALAVAGALWVSRRIVGPVHALKTAAARMQAGQAVPYRTTGLVECDEVAVALAEAAEAIQHGRSDLERQVADAVERTRQAEQRVSQSQRVEALGRLTGGVAHDFNNLLGVISNSAHLIERHPASADLQMPLAATLRAVEVGSQLTQHLLRFAGRRPVRPQAVELGRYLPELQELMRSVLGRRIEISVKVAPDTSPVRVDPGELELALINLALNARDAMPSGGELRLGARDADADDTEGLPGAPQRRYVLITVGDDGVGIAPDVAARVFEPFFTTKAVGKGTGLGLSQVHGFCVQAGGAARLASTPGLGTTVSLLLPASDGDDPAGVLGKVSAAALPGIDGMKVLLVEDNDELGDITSALLRSHGATVQCAGHAADALRLLQAQPFIDVVLSDVVMPGDMDGLAMARLIRRHHPTVAVVLISGYNTAAANSEFTVLRKPCPQEELLAALRDALALRARQGEGLPGDPRPPASTGP